MVFCLDLLENSRKSQDTETISIFFFLVLHFYYFDLGLMVLFIMRSAEDESDPLNSAAVPLVATHSICEVSSVFVSVKIILVHGQQVRG